MTDRPAPQAHPDPVSPEALAALAVDLRIGLMRLTRRLRQERTADLSPGQYAVLALLDREGPATAGVLAAAERMQPPSMTRILSCLHDAGLVTRGPADADRRQVLVRITPAGAAVVAEARARREAWLARELALLEPHDLDTVRRAVAVLDTLAGR